MEGSEPGDSDTPIHDWARVRAGKFHHCHNSWIYRLSDRLNAGLLPPGLYAAGEQIVGEIEPDVLTLQRDDSAAADKPKWQRGTNVLALEEHPPQVRSTMSADESAYVRGQDQLAIRAVEGDRLVAQAIDQAAMSWSGSSASPRQL